MWAWSGSGKGLCSCFAYCYARGCVRCSSRDVAINTRFAGHADYLGACFHSRAPLPVNNRQSPVLPHAPLLPQLLVVISVICPSRPTNGSSILELAICCSSCQPNHHGHSPPIVPAPAPHFLSNHSGCPNVSSARQPGPLLWPPPFEGRSNL